MTNDEMVLLSQGRIPAEAIFTPVWDYLQRADLDRDPSEPSELMLLCERQGLEYGTVAKLLYRWRNPDCGDGPVRGVDFDMADKLLCGASMFDMWRGELIDYYYKVDLRWKKCECTGCEVMFRPKHAAAGATGQKYCSKACKSSAQKIRNGRTHRRQKNWSGTKGKCRHGHARTPENTKFRGNGKMECLLCHRASAKRAYEKKMGRDPLAAAA